MVSKYVVRYERERQIHIFWVPWREAAPEEMKSVRSGLRSVACLSPGAIVIFGLEWLPRALSAPVALIQLWISAAPVPN